MGYELTFTDKGSAAIASAMTNADKTVDFSKVYLGSEDEFSKDTQVWSGDSTVVVSDAVGNVEVHVVVPAYSGGFTVRSAALADSGGNILATGKFPQSVKPDASSAAALQWNLRFGIACGSAAVIKAPEFSPVIRSLISELITDEAKGYRDDAALIRGEVEGLRDATDAIRVATDEIRVATEEIRVETEGLRDDTKEYAEFIGKYKYAIVTRTEFNAISEKQTDTIYFVKGDLDIGATVIDLMAGNYPELDEASTMSITTALLKETEFRIAEDAATRTTLAENVAALEAADAALAATDAELKKADAELAAADAALAETLQNSLTQLSAGSQADIATLKEAHDADIAALQESHAADVEALKNLIGVNADDIAAIPDQITAAVAVEESARESEIERVENYVQTALEALTGYNTARKAETSANATAITEEATARAAADAALDTRITTIETRLFRYDDEQSGTEPAVEDNAVGMVARFCTMANIAGEAGANVETFYPRKMWLYARKNSSTYGPNRAADRFLKILRWNGSAWKTAWRATNAVQTGNQRTEGAACDAWTLEPTTNFSSIGIPARESILIVFTETEAAAETDTRGIDAKTIHGVSVNTVSNIDFSAETPLTNENSYTFALGATFSTEELLDTMSAEKAKRIAGDTELQDLITALTARVAALEAAAGRNTDAGTGTDAGTDTTTTDETTAGA